MSEQPDKTELFFTAIKVNQAVLVRDYIESKEVNPQFAINDKGENGLHFAARCGAATTVSLLIQKNTPINAQDKKGYTPLATAIESDHFKCINYLMNSGPSLRGIQAPYGQTLLHIAARSNRAGLLVKLLSQDGALDRNAIDHYGNTPLHYAAESLKGHQLVQDLLNNGADPNQCNTEGYTPLDLAYRNNDLKACKALNKQNAQANYYTTKDIVDWCDRAGRPARGKKRDSDLASNELAITSRLADMSLDVSLDEAEQTSSKRVKR